MRRHGLSGRTLWRMLVSGALAALAGCTRNPELVSVPSEKEANHILVELARAGVSHAEKQPEEKARKTVWVIKVAPKELNAARELLVRLDLPRDGQPGFDAMLSQIGLIPTRSDERARMMHAIAGELARTLEAHDRVVAARVHVVLPDADPLHPESKIKTTASVFIKYVPGVHANEAPSAGERPDAGTTEDGSPSNEKGDEPEHPDWPLQRASVKRIVANGVEGLQPDHVEVVFAATEAAPPLPVVATPSEPAPPAPSTTTPKGPMLWYREKKNLWIGGLGLAVVVLCVRNIVLELRARRPAAARGTE